MNSSQKSGKLIEKKGETGDEEQWGPLLLWGGFNGGVVPGVCAREWRPKKIFRERGVGGGTTLVLTGSRVPGR